MLGTLFSLCAGILIGLKIYERYFSRKPEDECDFRSRKRMQEIIDQQKYGVIYLKNGERIVQLKDGKYLITNEEKPIGRRFFHDLWYGSGGGEDG